MSNRGTNLSSVGKGGNTSYHPNLGKAVSFPFQDARHFSTASGNRSSRTHSRSNDPSPHRNLSQTKDRKPPYQLTNCADGKEGTDFDLPCPPVFFQDQSWDNNIEAHDQHAYYYENQSGYPSFTMRPHLVTVDNPDVSIYLNSPLEQGAMVEVIIQSSRQYIPAVERPNPYTVIFAMPKELFGSSSSYDINFKINGFEIGKQKIHCKGSLEVINSIFRNEDLSLHVLQEALGTADMDKIDEILYYNVKDKMPYSRNFSEAAVYGETDAIEHIFPTWLHFSAHYGFQKLATALFDLPQTERWLNKDNSYALTPIEISKERNHYRMTQFLEDIEFVIKLSKSHTSEATSAVHSYADDDQELYDDIGTGNMNSKLHSDVAGSQQLIHAWRSRTSVEAFIIEFQTLIHRLRFSNSIQKERNNYAPTEMPNFPAGPTNQKVSRDETSTGKNRLPTPPPAIEQNSFGSTRENFAYTMTSDGQYQDNFSHMGFNPQEEDVYDDNFFSASTGNMPPTAESEIPEYILLNPPSASKVEEKRNTTMKDSKGKLDQSMLQRMNLDLFRKK